MEVNISKNKNVAQMSKPIYIKVKNDQGHLYIVIFGIYRRCQAAIPIFDILIGFGVTAERLNLHAGIFRFLGVFRPSWPQQTKIKKSNNAII